MVATEIHSIFDMVAMISSFTVTFLVYRWRLGEAAQRIEKAGLPYAFALVMGALIGGYTAGTLNLWLSGTHELGRSIVGALAGAIIGVELYKKHLSLKTSTGLIFVPAFATSVMVGRWGCYFSGLPDHTYGTATQLPWGHDFGDGITRHPVQLYESFALAIFLTVALILIGQRNRFFMKNGFYVLVLYYAAQRFIWEFLKPYSSVISVFNIFHFVCLGLIVYAVYMIWKSDEPATP